MKTGSATETANCILEKDTINRKLRRMALQIAEDNIGEKELIIAGIAGNGDIVAQNLVNQLKSVTDIPLQIVSIKLNKKDPLNAVLQPAIVTEGKTVILVDDVANTGKTMLFALKAFLNTYPKKIQTLVLVERSHKLFPVQSDYVGLSLATTLQDHIFVEVKGDELLRACLS